MTLTTMLNKAGVAPRTAREIIRHSDIRLTLTSYTDASRLNVSGALDSLPELSPRSPSDNDSQTLRSTGTDGDHSQQPAPVSAPKTGDHRKSKSSAVILKGDFNQKAKPDAGRENPSQQTKKALSEVDSDKAKSIGVTAPTLNRRKTVSPASSTHSMARSSRNWNVWLRL